LRALLGTLHKAGNKMGKEARIFEKKKSRKKVEKSKIFKRMLIRAPDSVQISIFAYLSFSYE
jgi:hypothetical protein